MPDIYVMSGAISTWIFVGICAASVIWWACTRFTGRKP